MASVRAEEIRVPKTVREAVGQHELSEVIAGLRGVRSPDPDFAADLAAVLISIDRSLT
ncbi:hypothetical protein [Microlunatus parietis]|uniref:Uncharacterized protein n=1 Tax=Microlunatus parietis TaxID=682979 RepID=A0A7Y9I9E2_9ACTN|nr:hypothetical protein [Microlunatus parietis]NYE72381.1 hypothetical protein [Microlunatus parietis]